MAPPSGTGLQVDDAPIDGIKVITNGAFADERGQFMEVFRRDVFEEAGLPTDFPQLNQSRSARGVIRGLHFQWDPPMGKLMRVTAGKAFLVAVDIRQGSPTLGAWYGRVVAPDDRVQIWAPAAFARGFCALEDGTEVQYLCTGIYNSAGEGGIRFDDPAIAVTWPVTDPIVSAKDRAAPTLDAWLRAGGGLRFAGADLG
jgi:dTDP-4-dehydrorhamnose 3,5-epimerase